jgi:hypothetical protein
MSLINDALKKAQQLQDQGKTPPPPGIAPGGSGAPSRPAGRERPLPRQVFVLLSLGAGVLIALSVLATVYLLRRPPALSPAGAAAPVVAQVPAALSPTGAAAPILPEKPAIAPVIKTSPPALPVLHSLGEGGSLPAVSLPAPSLSSGSNPSNGPATAPAVAVAPATQQPPAIVLSLPPAAPTQLALPVLRSPGEGGSLPALSLSNGPDPSKPDLRILAYLDALQIAGIRVTDTGSKVLMNDRVYRENEIVDRLLGLRLKTITEDALTFVDERGVIYTKNF